MICGMAARVGVFSRGDELRRFHKFIPQNVMNVRLDQHIRHSAPRLIGRRLNDGERAADDFNRIPRFGLQQSRFQMNPNHHLRAHLAHGRRWNLLGKKSIHQIMILMLHRQKKPRISARSPQRRPNLSLGEMNRDAFQQVGGDNCQRDAHLMKIFRRRQSVQKIRSGSFEAMPMRESVQRPKSRKRVIADCCAMCSSVVPLA